MSAQPPARPLGMAEQHVKETDTKPPSCRHLDPTCRISADRNLAGSHPALHKNFNAAEELKSAIYLEWSIQGVRFMFRVKVCRARSSLEGCFKVIIPLLHNPFYRGMKYLTSRLH